MTADLATKADALALAVRAFRGVLPGSADYGRRAESMYRALDAYEAEKDRRVG
jgi:hypothetical protein